MNVHNRWALAASLILLAGCSGEGKDSDPKPNGDAPAITNPAKNAAASNAKNNEERANVPPTKASVDPANRATETNEAVAFDRTTVLRKLDEAIAKADGPNIKAAFEKIRKCAEDGETSLDLSFDQLTTLPPEIGWLTELTNLHLEGNQLFELPREFGNLTKLERLDLRYSLFTAPPTLLGQLTVTTVPPEIRKLTKLKWLDLDDSQLTSLPAEIGHLTKLTELISARIL